MDQFVIVLNLIKRVSKLELFQTNGNYNLNGRVALITGSAKGIGRAIAKLFAKSGANIILVDKDEKIKIVSDELNNLEVKSLPIVCDLTVSRNLSLIVDKSIKEFKKIDILVNNAGVAFLDDAENLSKYHWENTINVNLTVPFLLSQSVGKEMISRKYGKIINIASQAGIVAIDKHIAYGTSKAGIISMTKSLALEWAKYNINVIAVKKRMGGITGISEIPSPNHIFEDGDILIIVGKRDDVERFKVEESESIKNQYFE